MRLNRTSEWKVMTIWISRGHPLFNFERLDILSPRIGHPRDKLWPFDFSRCSVVQFRASRYIMHFNWTSKLKVMTIWISRGYLLFNFERLDVLFPRIVHSSEKLWPFEFLDRFRCSIASVSIYYAPKSHIRVKGYDHLNFSRASIVQFRASRYISSLNRTFLWKVMTI